MILCAVSFAVAGMLVINRLPKLYHPLFGTPRFGLASEDRFFLYIDAQDPKFDRRAHPDLPRQPRRVDGRGGAAMRKAPCLAVLLVAGMPPESDDERPAQARRI